MALTITEFRQRLREDERRMAAGEALPGAPICAICQKPIATHDNLDPLGPKFIVENGKHHRVHVDCYFEEWGNEIDKHPLISPRIRGRR